ncbi:MAG: AAA family ATPase [Acidimicrobiales bacterium]
MSSLRIAVAGKGGAGKTTLSATLSRLLARRGRDVIVIDGDSNPNSAVALGVDRALAESQQPLPITLVSRKMGGPALKDPVDQVLAEHSIPAPDHVRVLMMCMPKHADEGCLCTSHATVAGLMNDMAEREDSVVVLDLEASPEHLSRGTTRNVDALFLVVEPYYRSYETAKRMAALAAELPIKRVAVVANKLRNANDAEAIREFCEMNKLNLDGELPWSEAAINADKAGIPVLDYEPTDPFVAAVAKVADKLTAVSD